MSTTMLVIIGVVVAGLVLGFIYVSHTNEKKRRQQALITANLTEKIQQLERLIQTTPPAYMSSDLKLVLLNECLKRAEKIQEVALDSKKAEKIADQIKQQINDTQNDQSKHTAPQLKSPEEANQVRNQLMAIHKVLEALAQSGGLSASDANRHLQQIQDTYLEATVNHTLHVARNAEQEGKFKLAMHHYQKAIGELSKRNQNNRFQDKIAQLKGRVGELQEKTGHDTTAATTDENGNELTKGLENLIEDDNSWKKKYF